LTSKYLTNDEAAQYLRIKPSTLRRWTCERKIPFRKHGSKTLFCVEDLDSWSAENTVDSEVDEHDNLLSSLKAEYQSEFE